MNSRKQKSGKKNQKKTVRKIVAGMIGAVLLAGMIAFAGWPYLTRFFGGNGRREDSSSLYSGVQARQCQGPTGKTGKVLLLKAASEEEKAALKTGIEEMNEKRNHENKLVVIDAGHQEYQNSETEPVGPGASEMKAKVSSGTAGIQTGVPEYQVTLDVSLLLQAELESRGYRVLMVRTANDVNISNSERAMLANENQADAFVRIHCDGSEDPSANGAMTICMTQNSPYCAELYPDSRILSEEILNHLCQETGAKKNRVWETDTMSGINWCEVPVSIVEMGYMTNPEEDRKLTDAEYQKKLAKGIADGIAAYLDIRK